VTSTEVIRKFQLEPLPDEGGYFRRYWYAREEANAPALGKADSYRSGSAIYYMLTGTDCSRLHRLATDEIWHFYQGSPVELYLFYPEGKPRKIILDSTLSSESQPTAVVPAGTLMGARLCSPGNGSENWALMGCTLSPSYEEKDFHLVSRQEALSLWPEYKDWIIKLTPDQPR